MSATPPGSAIVLSVTGLTKRYETRDRAPVLALDDIALEVRQGEFISVVGPSGCGKSTLLRILAGLLPRSAGVVELEGRTLDGPSRDVGVVFQSPTLLPWRTILENVMVPVLVQRRERRQYESRARDLLAVAGLTGFADRYPGELSGGMQQRVGICRALVHNPSFLLMDEPFGALDAMTRETMNIELQRIWSDSTKTILFVTHSIPEAVFLGSRVVVMTPRPGRIAELIDIDLPRPRQLDMINTPCFGRYVSRVRAHFGTAPGASGMGLDS
ncbi:MAG: ABC transporter ATP-binding protein [Janthinobacterium lividum]